MNILLIFQIIFLCSMSEILFLIDSIKLMYVVALITTLISASIQLFGRFKTRLLFIWEGAFLYIIGFEGLLHHNEILMKYGSSAIDASRYLVVTFFISIIGYLLGYTSYKKNNSSKKVLNESSCLVHYQHSAIMVLFLLTSYLIFIFLNYRSAISALYGGRSSVTRYSGELYFLIGAINSALTMTLPAVLAFSFKYVFKTKKYIFHSILFSIPIFAILFLIGTRFIFLFSFVGFAIVLLGEVRIRFKHIIVLLIIGFLLIYIGNIMRASRTVGFANYMENNNSFSKKNFLELLYTREGITVAVSMLIDYFRYNPYMHGASMAFVFIFWIPRSLWPNKPTMLGYWLIREMQLGGYGPGHSISFGFAGDAYADFGFIGGIIFSLVFGYLIQRLERQNNKVLVNEYDMLYIAMTYPFVFFAMRSLQTALISFIGMIVYLRIFKKTLKIQIIETKNCE